MNEYPKIDTIYKRDMEAVGRPLLEGQWSKVEFEFLADCLWIWTEKIDGTNIRIMYDGEGNRVFGGRTAKSQMPTTLVAALQNIFDPLDDTINEKFPHGVTLYGEGYGPGIQKVGNFYREDQSFVLFDIKIGHWWLKGEDTELITADLGIDHVPVAGIGTLEQAVDFVKAGFNSNWGDFEAEGLVCRPMIGMLDRGGRRIITKIKGVDFK